jgi:Membrane domain of glycerophosphoryl diester phosphodiesterase
LEVYVLDHEVPLSQLPAILYRLPGDKTPMTVSSTPQGPLTVGNVVSAGLQLYRNHFKQYFGVAVQATLWGLLPFLAVIGAGIALAVLQIDSPGLIALLIAVGVVLFLYGIGKYMAKSAAIARLAFGELTNQPESTDQASRFTNSRIWGFWGVALLIGLLYSGLLFGLYLGIAVIAFVLILALGGLNAAQAGSFEQWFTSNPAIAFVGLPAFLLLIIGIILLFAWVGARFAIAELPLAIETEVGVIRSIGRSWQLTQKSAWRIVLILFVTFLITIPLQILVQVVTNFLQVALVAVVPDTAFEFSVVMAATYAIGLVAGVIVLPLWQTIKAVIYYDQRSRREGLGLEIRDRQS